jgi:PAP2 superfamily.
MITVAVGALVVGLLLNATLVPGRYEWLGLFRIFGEVSHRPGFWILCLVIWLAGVRHAPTGRHLLSRNPVRGLGLWLGTAASGLALMLARPGLIDAGSWADAVCFVVLVPGLALHLLAASGGWRERRREARTLALAAIFTLLVYTLVAFGHTMAKGSLFVGRVPADELLQQADLFLLGTGFYQHLAEYRVAHPMLTRGLDLVYVGLLQQLWWSIFYFYGAKDIRNGRPYLLAMLLILSLGSLAYFPIPSRGPLYYDRTLFADVGRLAPDSAFLAGFLSQQTTLTKAGCAHAIAPFGFIAAMPSLHVGQALIMLLGMRRSAMLCVLNLCMLLFTVVATTVLGWHYFVDDIVGAALGLGCWAMACKIVSWDRASQKASAPAPVQADFKG